MALRRTRGSVFATRSRRASPPVRHFHKRTPPRAATVFPARISHVDNQAGITSTPFSFTPIVENLSLLSLTFSMVGSLPNGLVIASHTGTISGTPTTPGTTTGLQIRADFTDGYALSNAFQFTITSSAPPPLSKLGMNVAPIFFFSSQFVFKNLIRQGEEWISGIQFGTFDDGYAIPLDGYGYPKSIRPPDGGHPSGYNAKTLMAWALNGAYPAGTYSLTFSGAGSFTKNEQDSGGIMATMTATTNGNTINNAKLLIPGMSNEDAAPFYPPFLDSLAGFGTLRFMDWAQVNNSTLSSWNQRVLPTYRTQAGNFGTAYEYQILLGNTLGVDIWVNVPHLADDNFITQLATLVHNTFNSSLKCYFELSNECWNAIFTQYSYFNTVGANAGYSGTTFDKGRKAYSARAVQMFDLIAAVYGADMSTRARRVMGGFSDVPSMAQTILNFQSASLKTDIYAIAPYFGASGATSGMTTDQILDLVETAGNGIDLQKTKVNGITAVLGAYSNVKLAFYEFGQSLTTFGSDPALDAKYAAANRTARMETVYNDYLTKVWKEAGGSCVANHYFSCDIYRSSGSWGAIEHLDNLDTPKYRSLVANQ